ncbi:MAG: SYNERG-CTERM sorting domain-containing protein, partial [Synergistaceae bacterium]|nr:SYNERG-CTERM sorting domain-containing protein [Synergistaceae bacterium]
ITGAGKLTVNGVNANYGSGSPGSVAIIGGGSLVLDKNFTGSLEANGGNGGEGQIGGNGGVAVSGVTVTINGGALTAKGGNGAKGGSGGNGAVAISGCKVTVNGGTLNATGGNGNTGNPIGNGGDAISGSTVTLNDGTLTATGGIGSITGGGKAGSGGVAISKDVTVTLNGGTLTATGGAGGSGFEGNATYPGGDGGDAVSGTVTLGGGSLTATGGAGGDSSENGKGSAGKAVSNTGSVTAAAGYKVTFKDKNGNDVSDDNIVSQEYLSAASVPCVAVTFKVVNGSWDDGTTADKTVTPADSNGGTLKLAVDQIPAVGNKPAANYEAGKWDATPSTETAITTDTTYTYTYSEKSQSGGGDPDPAPTPTPAPVTPEPGSDTGGSDSGNVTPTPAPTPEAPNPEPETPAEPTPEPEEEPTPESESATTPSPESLVPDMTEGQKTEAAGTAADALEAGGNPEAAEEFKNATPATAEEMKNAITQAAPEEAQQAADNATEAMESQGREVRGEPVAIGTVAFRETRLVFLAVTLPDSMRVGDLLTLIKNVLTDGKAARLTAEDDDSATVFLDSAGKETKVVPEDRKVTMATIFEGGKTYQPVIVATKPVETEAETEQQKSGGSNSGCDAAGLGLFALAAALPLIFRKARK